VGDLLEESEPWTAAGARSAVSVYAGLRGRASVKDTSGRADNPGDDRPTIPALAPSVLER